MRSVYRLFNIASLASLIVLLIFSNSNGQSSPGWGISFQSGISNTRFNESTKSIPDFGFNLQYDISRLFTINASFNKGIFKSINANNYFGRLFRNNYYDFSFQPQMNFINGISTVRNLRFYGFAGIGIIQNHVTTSLTKPGNGDLYKLFEGVNNKTTTMYYIFGIGTRYDISSRLGIYFQYQQNYTNSDFIDGFVTVNGVKDPGPRNFKNDDFSSFKLGITIRLGKTPRSRKSYYPDQLIPSSNTRSEVTKDSLMAYKVLVNRYAEQLDESNKELEKANELVNELLKLKMKDQLYKQQSTITSLRNELDSLKIHARKPDTNLANIKKEIKHSSPKKDRNYYIIADTFLNKSKANELLGQLKKSGYPNADVIMDESRVWFMVTYAKVSNEKDAKKMLDHIRNFQNPTAWLYQVK